MKASLFAVVALVLCHTGAIAQPSANQSESRRLTYEQVLERWDRSRAHGDPRDLRTFSKDMVTRRQTGDEADDFSEGLRDGIWIRFYARGEQIFGDSTDLVFIGAVIGILFASYRFVILPLQRMPGAITHGRSVASSPDDSAFYGVQGWLLFLCIWTTVLWPLFTFSTLHRMSEEWMCLFIGLIIFAIVSGVILWRANPVGLVLVRTFLIGVVGLNLFGILVYGGSNPDRVPLTIFQGAIPIAWLIYTYQSKRVRATFRSSPQPPTSQQ